MNREEREVFNGIFKRIKYFELPELNYDAEEVQDILDSYSHLPLPEAIENITRKIIRHMEALTEPDSVFKVERVC